LNQAAIQKNSGGTGPDTGCFLEVTGNTVSKGFGHMSMAGQIKLAVGAHLKITK
jgi:hypothetical protein